MNNNMAITGVGIISGSGRSIDEFYEVMQRKKPVYKHSSLPESGKKKGMLFLDNSEKKLYAAFEDALSDSGLNMTDKDKIGIFIGNAFGALDSTVNVEMKAIKNESIMPMDFINTVMNAAAGQLAVLSGIKGMNVTISDGSVSSSDALAYCAHMLAVGRISAAVVGGAEEGVFLYEEYIKCRGAVPADGVCIFIAEPLEDALNRKARIYAVWKGSAGGYYAKADNENILAVMKEAADNAGITIDELDFIVSGGILPCENEVISRMDIPVFYLKNIIGENYGAFGAFAAAAAAAIIKNGKMPDGMVLSGRKRAMIVNAGFDGYISCFVLESIDS